MEAFWPAAGALLGAIVGSFLATILVRWPEGRSIVRGRSACDSCAAPLPARDLVPILSWLVLRGRCRRCGARIDGRHLAVELAAALVGLVSFAAHPLPLALATAIFGWWLLLIAALDVEREWLPDLLTLPLIAAGLGAAWLGFGPPPEARLIGAAAGFLFLAFAGWAYRAVRGRVGLGGGDPKLLAATGAWLGWPLLPHVMLGAGLIGLAVLLLKRLRGEPVAATDRLPLGALMALAAWPIWLVVTR